MHLPSMVLWSWHARWARMSGVRLLVQLWLSAFARIALLSAAAGVLVARHVVLLLATASGLSMQSMAIQTLAQPAKVRGDLLLQRSGSGAGAAPPVLPAPLFLARELMYSAKGCCACRRPITRGSRRSRRWCR